MKAIRKTGMLILAASLVATQVGCATYTSDAHTNLQTNLNTLVSEAKERQTLPSVAAKFCLERAKQNFETAGKHTTADGVLLTVSAILAVSGLGVQAVGAGLSAPSDEPNGGPKKGFETAGLTTLAVAGGMLAVRTAAGQSELALAKRTAAAKQVDAAFILLADYAMVDDVRDLAEKGIGPCKDADIDVANGYPSASSQALAKVIEVAKERKEEKVKDVNKAEEIQAKKAEEVAKDEVEVQDRKKKEEDAEAKNPKPANLAELKQAKKKADEDLLRAQGEKDKADRDAVCKKAELTLADRKLGVVVAVATYRKALFFGTQREVKLAEADLDAGRDLIANGRGAVTSACAP